MSIDLAAFGVLPRSSTNDSRSRGQSQLQLWPHLGLRADDPPQVREAKLCELVRSPAWPDAPAALRTQAEEFLRGN
ncbi:hypothetical protein [Streptomyces xanthophaeus]|uniref:hypothetical protein n=1 Tax=Streptomyces xanthophaeus TaxID=67385 RepID=UPI00371CB2C2